MNQIILILLMNRLYYRELHSFIAVLRATACQLFD